MIIYRNNIDFNIKNELLKYMKIKFKKQPYFFKLNILFYDYKNYFDSKIKLYIKNKIS